MSKVETRRFSSHCSLCMSE